MTERISWDQYFMQEAARVAQRSKDPAKQVGAIIVRPDKTEASRGYNGFPPGIADTEERLHDKEFKGLVIMHAEENAIRSARGENLSGCTLYVTPYMPCAHCASWIISSGITRVVTDMAVVPEKWRRNFEITKEIFDEAGVSLDMLSPEDSVETDDIEIGFDVPFAGEPHFVMVDDEGCDPALCQVIFEDVRDIVHFKTIWGDIEQGSYFVDGRGGTIGPDRGVSIARPSNMLPKQIGTYTVCWRGTARPGDDFDWVRSIAKRYRARLGY